LCKTFYFKKYDFDAKNGLLSLVYEIPGYDPFVETVRFDGAPFEMNDAQKRALGDVFFYTHLICGINYYKGFLPQEIIIESSALSSSEAELFAEFYLNGLGEFAATNNLNLQGKIHFPHKAGITRFKSKTLCAGGKSIIPIGGGKDSCVSIELLRRSGHAASAAFAGDISPIRAVLEKSGLDLIHFDRKIDPAFMQLCRDKKVYTGHLPISAIYACYLWIYSVLKNYQYVVMSNERSSDSPNMMQGDLAINHQYSKSYAFENWFHKLTQKITPMFCYFSLLRPLSEAHIARLFSKMCTRYFDTFTSCNRVFRLDRDKRSSSWCGQCDKCRFVFLILAPFMDKETLVKCVGNNPLNDEMQLNGYMELLGLSGHKPFECVGTIAESVWAFAQLAERADYANDFIIKQLAEKLPKAEAGDLFIPSQQHNIPGEFKDVMALFKQ
jgi:hypothetical protein